MQTEVRISRSPRTRTPLRKFVKNEHSAEPATPLLESQRESPGLLLSPLHTTPELSPVPKKKRSPRNPKPSTTVSKPPEETSEPNQKEPACHYPGRRFQWRPEPCPAGNSGPSANTYQAPGCKGLPMCCLRRRAGAGQSGALPRHTRGNNPGCHVPR